MVTESGFSGIMNTEPSRIAPKSKICYERAVTVASCANEILSDLVRFYADNVDIWPIWSFNNFFAPRLLPPVDNEMLMMVEMVLPGTPMFYHESGRPKNVSVWLFTLRFLRKNNFIHSVRGFEI